MNLKNNIIITFLVLQIFMVQPLQAMEWLLSATALKIGAITIMSAGVVAYKLKEHFGSVYRVEKKIDAVQEDVQEVKDGIAEVKGSVATLQNNFTTQINNLLELQQQFTDMQTKVKLGFMSTQEAHEEMKNKLLEIEAQLQSAESMLSDIKDTSGATNAKIAEFEAKLAQLQQSMDGFKASLAVMEEKIAQLPTTNDVKGIVTDAINPVNETLQRIVEGQDRQAELFNQAIQNLSNQAS
ncbi:MAG: hypothetical protein M1114_04640, partial [Candidatus Dependentiae bacterium]|nr:hypothetical protein [Candidatus Dependentiae bacterium]